MEAGASPRSGKGSVAELHLQHFTKEKDNKEENYFLSLAGGR